MATVSLDQEAIHQLSGERKALLDTVDGLRKLGIGRFVDLPQIIVVGDQSSGKSSVLEAISRVRFPIKDGLCTRFATEFVLRTDPHTKVHVQIQPASGLTNKDCEFNETKFNTEDLPRIIEEAKARLLRHNARFSEDVLRVEIRSPHVPHLTLVDLPGFYHSESDEQHADGLKIVNRLVETYMARQNSIILAIVSARNSFVMQKVLAKVKGHDRNLQRTLGIVTKPDVLITDSEDEEKFIRLAKNQEKSYQLALGWHVLRNRSEKEASLSSAERDSQEHEFFDSGVWSAIPSNNRGIDTLRKKLANVLLDHVRGNLGTLIKDIQDNLDNRKRTLERLGGPRSSPLQLRAHLDKIASQFQLLSLRAIEGNYSDEFFGGLYPKTPSDSIDDNRVRKLRALVRDLNRTFSWVLATRGSRRIIVAEHTDGNKIDTGNTESNRISLPPFLHVLETQYPFNGPPKVTRDEVRLELEPLSSANQGTEFPGTTNDLLAVKLFQDQSHPWEMFARFHVDFMLRIVKSFAEKLVTYITGLDERTCSAILSNIIDPFFEKCTLKLEEKLQELLYHFQSGYPQPSDAEFRAILAKRHQGHLTAEVLQNLVADRPELFTEKGKRQITELSGQKSEFGVDSLIDKSETYYELSLRIFTDNVIILAIENCLIKDLPTIFTTGVVSQMNDEMLERLAAESADIQAERAELEVECEALQKGFDLCKTYRTRNATVLPDPFQSRGKSAATEEASTSTPNAFRQSFASLSMQNRNGFTASTSPQGGAATTSSGALGSGIIGNAISQSLASTPNGPNFLTSGNTKIGSTTAPSLFGTSSNTAWKQAPAPTSSLFSNVRSTTIDQAPATGSSLFGARTNASTEQGSTSGFGLFGAPRSTAASNNATSRVGGFGASGFGSATEPSPFASVTGPSIFGPATTLTADTKSYKKKKKDGPLTPGSLPNLKPPPRHHGPVSYYTERSSDEFLQFRHICAHESHRAFSPEELRLMGCRNWMSW
ncbi:P-loop containing nucleoside triphosphate hydrolase protein [Xylaria castorea]|nr:P-loop containing nucleoside triphosphate hydrolase protein [Xylaria castorea]